MTIINGVKNTKGKSYQGSWPPIEMWYYGSTTDHPHRNGSVSQPQSEYILYVMVYCYISPIVLDHMSFTTIYITRRL